MELIIGPRAYSTWSLRGWLVMKATGADFAVIDARYDTPEHKAALQALSPSGFVPVAGMHNPSGAVQTSPSGHMPFRSPHVPPQPYGPHSL